MTNFYFFSWKKKDENSGVEELLGSDAVTVAVPAKSQDPCAW